MISTLITRFPQVPGGKIQIEFTDQEKHLYKCTLYLEKNPFPIELAVKLKSCCFFFFQEVPNEKPLQAKTSVYIYEIRYLHHSNCCFHFYCCIHNVKVMILR